jgi:hypothetical protein
LIGLDDSVVCVAVMLLEPTQQRRPKVEADVGVVIDRALIAGSPVGNCGESVWPVTLGMNPFVPIMKGRGTGLFFNDTSPWVFAWWLIEVTVNDETEHVIWRHVC